LFLYFGDSGKKHIFLTGVEGAWQDDPYSPFGGPATTRYQIRYRRLLHGNGPLLFNVLGLSSKKGGRGFIKLADPKKPRRHASRNSGARRRGPNAFSGTVALFSFERRGAKSGAGKNPRKNSSGWDWSSPQRPMRSLFRCFRRCYAFVSGLVLWASICDGVIRRRPWVRQGGHQDRSQTEYPDKAARAIWSLIFFCFVPRLPP